MVVYALYEREERNRVLTFKQFIMKRILISATPVLSLVVDVLLITQLSVALYGHFCRSKKSESQIEETKE